MFPFRPFRKNRGNQSRPTRQSYQPRIEGLEERTVPTGNVTAVISGGNLVVTGDSGDNQIRITGSRRGPIDIEAIDTGTVINNQPGMVTLLGFRGAIIVNMGDGNDTLDVRSVGPRTGLRVDMGAGDDTLTIESATISSFVDINLGTGDDVMNLQSLRLNSPSRFDAGVGNDQINLSGARLDRQAFFISGGGVDSIGYVNAKVGQMPSINGFGQVANSSLPRALEDSATVTKGGSTTINVISNDNVANGTIDSTTVKIVTQPKNGTATVLGNGSILYTHNGTFTSTDSLQYTVKNNSGAVSNIANVKLTITGFTGPTVALTTSATSPTKTSPIPYTATFSDDVTDFALSDLTVTNGAASSFVAVNGRTYTFNVTPTGDGAVSVTVPAGVASNALGLSNSASSPVAVTFDSTSPVITINALTTNDTTPTLTGTVNDSSSTVKVTVNNKTYTATISGTTWTANVTDTLAEGTYAIAATATDPAGNTATANNATGLKVDLTAPTVVISSETTGPINQNSITVDITFSEAVGNFVDASKLTITNGTASNFTAEPTGAVYHITLTRTQPGVVTVSLAAGKVNDAAGNLNTVSNTFSIDLSAPAVSAAITSSVTGPTTSATIPITVTFNQNVTGFTASDIVVSNGTLSNFASVDAKTYTATVTATASGTVTVDVPANSAINGSSEGNAAAPTFSIVYNNAPTVAITSSVTGPTSSPTIPITVTFNQDVTGFDASDIVVGNGTLSNFAAVDAKTYTATVTATANGTVTVDVPANAAQNSVNGGNAAAPQFSIAFSNSAPTVARTIANISKTVGAADQSFFLSGTFDDADIGMSKATLNILKGATPETIHLEFFDRAAPLSVANFLAYQTAYASDGGVTFHRMVLQSGLEILQGGGYTYTDLVNGTHIPTLASIVNEYSDAHQNTRGTIAMARTSDPNSATSEFFFNLDDANASTLGASNGGGYAVFGQVVGAADLAVLDDLATVHTVDAGNGFTNFPTTSTGGNITQTDTLRISSLDITDRGDKELSYTVQSSNTNVATATTGGFQGNQLSLHYGVAGTSTITVTATDSAGHTATTTFVVTVS